MDSYAFYPFSVFKQLLFGSETGTAGVMTKTECLLPVSSAYETEKLQKWSVLPSPCYLAVCNNLVTPEGVS